MPTSVKTKKKTTTRRQPSIPALLKRAHAGDALAFRELFLLHLPSFERFVQREIHYYETLGVIERGLLDPRAIIDQVYLAAFHNLKERAPHISFRAWLRQLALNVTRQQARMEHDEEPIGPALERPTHEHDYKHDPDSEFWEFYQPDDVSNVEDMVADRNNGDPEEWMEAREKVDEIEHEINQLPADLRDAFVLRVIEGLSVDEIAELKHKPATLIRQWVHDAKEELKRRGVALKL